MCIRDGSSWTVESCLSFRIRILYCSESYGLAGSLFLRKWNKYGTNKQRFINVPSIFFPLLFYNFIALFSSFSVILFTLSIGLTEPLRTRIGTSDMGYDTGWTLGRKRLLHRSQGAHNLNLIQIGLHRQIWSWQRFLILAGTWWFLTNRKIRLQTICSLTWIIQESAIVQLWPWKHWSGLRSARERVPALSEPQWNTIHLLDHIWQGVVLVARMFADLPWKARLESNYW